MELKECVNIKIEGKDYWKDWNNIETNTFTPKV